MVANARVVPKETYLSHMKDQSYLVQVPDEQLIYHMMNS